jgi:hypothetical protein
MRIQSCLRACLAAAVCVMAGLPTATADDAPGIVRMTDFQPTQFQQTAFVSETATPVAADCADLGCVEGEGCQVIEDCPDSCQSGGSGSCNGCPCGCCGTDGESVLSHMFGGSIRRCTCDYCEYCGKGTGHGCKTLFGCLFGSMVPSGHSNQGSPLLGHYQITYANQPSYADARDGQAWGARGYGMPITVPTAPVVRYSYNYSHGTPASRLTPLSTYNSATSTQPLFLQSW